MSFTKFDLIRGISEYYGELIAKDELSADYANDILSGTISINTAIEYHARDKEQALFSEYDAFMQEELDYYNSLDLEEWQRQYDENAYYY